MKTGDEIGSYLLVDGIRVDEQVALSLLFLGLAALIHAFAYTAAESAHPTKRWIFQRGADLLALLSLYGVFWIWF